MAEDWGHLQLGMHLQIGILWYNKQKKIDMALPEVILAFKLLDCTGLEHKDRQLMLTGVDYKKTFY